MPRFNTTDVPIAQDNYGLVATTSQDPRYDACVLGFEPGTLTDWNGDTDPGHLDAAVDQLADRVDNNENALAGLSNDHGSLGGLADDDHTQYLLADGTRAVVGDMLVAGGGELRLRATDQRLFSPSTGILAVDAGTQLQLHISGAAELLVFPDQMTFKQPGFNNPGFRWSIADQLDLRLGATTLVTFKSQEVDVAGVVTGTGLRVGGMPPGVVGTNTFTGGSDAPDPQGTKPAMDKLPAGFSTSSNAGWITVRVGTITAVIPYWKA
ncbi:MAG: hypothetical protein ACE5E5_13335 [Phycisphaerae bacterium]